MIRDMISVLRAARKKDIDIGKMIIMIMMTVMQRVLSDNANIFSAVSDFPHCDANE